MTYRGQAVARLVPAARPSASQTDVEVWLAELAAEIAGGLRRRTGRRVDTRRVVRHLLALPGVRIIEADQRRVWRAMLLAATVGRRGADAVYVATAHQEGMPLVTWDSDQSHRAGRLIAVYSPLTDPV